MALYFYASLVLGFFPWTRGYAQVLIGYVLSPLKIVGDAFVAYLPNVFFIAVIVLVSFYVTKFIRIIFAEIGKQTITLPGFYPEWAEPTYNIVRFLVFTLTADRDFSLFARLQVAGFPGNLHFSRRAFFSRIDIGGGQSCGWRHSDLHACFQARGPRQNCGHHGRRHRKDAAGHTNSHDQERGDHDHERDGAKQPHHQLQCIR